MVCYFFERFFARKEELNEFQRDLVGEELVLKEDEGIFEEALMIKGAGSGHRLFESLVEEGGFIFEVDI